MSGEVEEEIDLFVFQNKDQRDGVTKNWEGLLIHENLKDLERIAILLLEIAQLDQKIVEDQYLPNGTSKQLYQQSTIELSRSSNVVITGKTEVETREEFYKEIFPKYLNST